VGGVKPMMVWWSENNNGSTYGYSQAPLATNSKPSFHFMKNILNNNYKALKNDKLKTKSGWSEDNNGWWSENNNGSTYGYSQVPVGQEQQDFTTVIYII
jgi:hypothetical protein